MNYIEQYQEKLETGEIVAGKKLKKVYAHIAANLHADAGAYYFDEREAEKAIGFIEGPRILPVRIPQQRDRTAAIPGNLFVRRAQERKDSALGGNYPIHPHLCRRSGAGSLFRRHRSAAEQDHLGICETDHPNEPAAFALFQDTRE